MSGAVSSAANVTATAAVKVGAGGVARDDEARRVAPVLRRVLGRPAHGVRAVVEAGRKRVLRRQRVVDVDDQEPLGREG